MNQSFQIDSTQLRILLAQGIATTLIARSESSSHNGNLSCNLIPNQNEPQHCSYEDILACEPISFHGTEGVVGLSSWIEKMEAIFRVCSCPDDWQVIYATCTLMESALVWWIEYATAVRFDVAYDMDWKDFKTMMVKTYCSQREIQELKQEFKNLTMKGSEVITYTLRFNELANLCPEMVKPEFKKTDLYIRGLVFPIQGLVAISKPTTFDSAKQLAYQVTEHSIRQNTMAPQTERNQNEGIKRKFDIKSERDSKRHKPASDPIVSFATNATTSDKSYKGKLPHCTKCNFHHDGNCMICRNCNLRGHISKFCKVAPPATNSTTTNAT